MNIIEFAESPEGLDMTLFPMQRVILKVFYKIPLSTDINENKIKIPDMFNETTLFEFNEKDCWNWLYQNKYTNLSYDDIYVENIPLDSIDFYIGRRGTKSKLFSIITCYSAYELLFEDDPHKMFNNKPVTDEIAITLVSNSLANASKQYREVTGAIAKSKFFKNYRVGPTKEGYWLKSKAFMALEAQGLTEGIGNLRISCKAANANVRGDANIIGGLDEYAHYVDSENSTKDKPLDLAMYEALAPSTYEFRANGRSYGKMFIISSPNGKKGNAYKRYQDSFTDKSYLMLNMPSFYVNPSLAPNKLKADYRSNPSGYEQEILGKFNAKVSKWLPNADLVLAASNQNNPNEMGWSYNPGFTYYMGIDFALDGDGTAVAIAHSEPKIPSNYEPIKPEYRDMLAQTGEIYIVDYIYYIQPQAGKTLEIEGIMKQIKQLVRVYNVRAGVYDQWSRALIERELNKYGLGTALTCLNATMQTNNDLSKTYKQLASEGRIITPRDDCTYPIHTTDWDMTYLEEVFQLMEYRSRNGMIKVENPSGHDDRYKAVEKAIYLAYTKAAPTITSLYAEAGAVVSSISGRNGVMVATQSYRKPLNIDLRKRV